MADNFLNKTGLQYYHNRIKTLFENKIETVKVNGTALAPDANKAVNIEIDDSVFVAKAFTTPVADIANAIKAGQTILVRYGNQTNLYQSVIAASSAPDKSSATIVVATISTEQGVKMADIIEYTITAAGWTQSAIITVDEAVFVATYGTTPAADIIAAIGDGKVICVTHGAGMPTEVVTYAHHNDGTAYLTTVGISVESDVDFPTASTYTVSGTTWSVATVQGARRADVQVIQEVIPSDASDENPLATQEWVQGMIDESLADITGIDFEVVQTLPATGQKGVIYLLHNPTDPTDIYDEYIWVDGTPGRFEKIGNTAVDLSDYWAKTELTAITTAEIDTIVES